MNELLDIDIDRKLFHSKNGVTSVLSQIKFKVEENEFLSIVGRSGCGKSTLLRIIAGLDTAFEGSITTSNANQISSFVFQDSGLFPWLTVYENLKFVNSDEILIDKMLSKVGLTNNKRAWIKELSGGMKQRLSIARGLINKPDLLLMDEPLRELDMITKEELQYEVKQLVSEYKSTTILVTHDIEEAIFFSNRIIILSGSPAVISKIFIIDVDVTDRTSTSFQALKLAIKKELN